MADYVKPVIDAVLAALEKRMPAALPVDREPVREFGRQFTGIVGNMPAVYVMPRRTLFDPDTQGVANMAHEIQITLAVGGSEPGQVTDAAMVYVRAVHQAILEADAAREITVTGGQVNRVYIASHDYGPLWEKGGGLARFPEIELIVEAMEAA